MPRLIPNWRAAPRMISMWAYAATISLVIAVIFAVATTKESMYPDDVILILLAVLVLQAIGAAGRMIAQPGLVDDIVAVVGDADS
jgi:hypothetical protein